jgi:hypothetical protein
MKTQMVILTIAFLIVSSATTPANSADGGRTQIIKKQDPGFAFIRTHRQGKGITVTWGAVSGSPVVSYTIQKTYQDPTDPYSFWEDVYSAPADGSRASKFTDNSVFPGITNYRVVALLEDGNSIMSDVSAVKIVSH